MSKNLAVVQQNTNGPELPVFAYNSLAELTNRERDVVQLVAGGFGNRAIAAQLGIQEQSVKNLVSVVMKKLYVENRTQLALRFHECAEGRTPV